MSGRILFLGTSLVTGIVGSTFIRHRKKTDEQLDTFVGHWSYDRQHQKGQVHVTVTTDLQLYIQNKLQPTTVIDYTSERLTLIDSMGYHIVFEQNGKQISFYDETEDTSFQLIKH